MEVGLLDAALLQRDLRAQHRRQPERNAGLDLRLHRIRIDHASQVRHHPHMMHLDRVVLDRNLRHLRHIGVVTLHQRQAAIMALGQRLAPAGLLRRRF